MAVSVAIMFNEEYRLKQFQEPFENYSGNNTIENSHRNPFLFVHSAFNQIVISFLKNIKNFQYSTAKFCLLERKKV
jgi:hypothetical protein